MHIGALICRLEDEDDAGLALEAIGDIALFAEVARIGEYFSESPAAYVAAAAARFANLANNEDWLTLVGALEGSDDTARALLMHMLRWAIAHDERDLPQGSRAMELSSGAYHAKI
jgi:hypothetical protein